jgi:dTDP-4-amino-4,6-dideoxy-D-galactose acyltransferase
MSASARLQTLDWDSRHFGLEIAQLDTPPDTVAELASVMREARESGIDCVYCLVAADDFERAWRMEAVGFVARDLRLEFHRQVDSTRAAEAQALRPCTESEVDVLAGLSASGFRRTRFAADPGFPRVAVARLYDVWLRNSVAGYADAVLVSGAVGAPQGFVTLHASGQVARIGLIAVDPAARGGGVGQQLVEGAIQWAADRKCNQLRVVTQGSNTAAQRLYQRCGFLSATAHTWFHAWPGRTLECMENPH